MEVYRWNLCYGKLILTHLSLVFLDINNSVLLIYVLFKLKNHKQMDQNRKKNGIDIFFAVNDF